MAKYRLVLKPAAAQKAAQGLGVSLVRKMSKVTTTRARKLAPGGPYSTGILKLSIKWEFTDVGADGVRSKVGSDKIYAHSVHEGSPARLIVPVRSDRLRFHWRRTGRRESFKYVNHPGTQAQPFLTTAMRQIAPRYGFKTVTYRS